MASKRTIGTIICFLGGTLAFIFGKPVIKVDLDNLFAVADIFMVAFGAGLILGNKK
ncbi:hypothetical protein LbDm2_2256 [Levilactobacillus brevis]|uniref:hypothetical protein n=1 Tax=Levilactobacillus brevis TaxID=1580 RepID=UPI0005837335|nr:hypothetical protein [Levilactobacillus brevis]KID42858.1 hypothetical protein LbDm2_2256 [Levilactobacillus brevis]